MKPKTTRLSIPELFNSIRCEISKEKANYYSDMLLAQYCTKCGQVFIARYDFIYQGLSSYWKGSFPKCPYCGTESIDHYNETRYWNNAGKVERTGKNAPESMEIILYEFKEHFKLLIKANCIAFEPQSPERVAKHKVKETFVFNAKTQKTLFSQTGGDKEIKNIEIANPLDPTLTEFSMLRFLTRNSYAWQKHKKEINILLNNLRTGLCKKLKQVKGYNIKRTAIPGNPDTGLLLDPIKNMAWRLAITDGPNLKEVLKNCEFNEETKKIYCPLTPNITKEDFSNIITECQKGKSYPQAVLKAFSLPDTKSGRRMIGNSDKPIYILNIIKATAIAGLDANGRKIIADKLKEHWNFFEGNPRIDYLALKHLLNEKGTDFFREAIHRIGQKKALPLITDLPLDQLNDTGKMYESLTPEEQETVWKNSTSAKKMHDTCTELNWKHKHPDYILDVPAHIVNRLMMQKDHLKFFLPGTYHQLHAAGQELKNCVGNNYYPEQMKNGKCCIVLVADNVGKLKVCIELRDNKILQAKLFDNQPVSDDIKLNNEIITWAKERKLEIKTTDVNIPAKANKIMKKAV